MKKLFYTLIFAALCLVSCNDDSGLFNLMLDTDQRIARLEELCSELNTNITSLQVIVEAQQSGDYITNITPITKDGQQIGYTITFAKHPAITIYNGENGKDGVNGTNGQNGQTPVLGAAKDTDGIYYWTLNGSWLLDGDGHKIRVTGEKGDKGDKGATGATGATGQNGTNGTNGTDGVTPQLKIQNDYWYISYDNGTTWTQLGKAKGDKGDKGATGAAGSNGTNGQDGQDGDSMFQSVTYDDHTVTFTLSDGTVLQVPIGTGSGSGIHNPTDIIEFKDFNVEKVLLPLVDSDNNGYITYAEAAAYNGSLSFKDNTDVVFFKEFQYFTSVSSVSFNRCTSLRYVVLPEGLTSITSGAFAHTKIKEINIPSSCVSIGQGAFEYSTIESVRIPANCVTIERNAFQYSSLSELTFEEGCISIGVNAFFDCPLSSVLLPTSITQIGNGAFAGCQFTSFVFPENLTEGLMAFGSSKNTLITSITWNCKNYTGTMHNATYGTGLAGYTTSENKRPNLSNVTIGDEVRVIPSEFLVNAGKITTITIPASVDSIGEAAFSGTGLKTMYCKSLTPPTIGPTSLRGIPSACIIYVPRESVVQYRTAWSELSTKIAPFDF